MTQYLKEKEVCIRKPHRCFGCGTVHQKGDQMEYNVQINDGHFINFYLCEPCSTYWAYKIDWSDCEGLGPSEIWEFDDYKLFRENFLQNKHKKSDYAKQQVCKTDDVYRVE